MPDTTPADPQLTADPSSVIYDVGLGFVRHGFTIMAGYLVSQGFLTKDNEQIFVAALLALVGFFWSAFEKLAAQRLHSLNLLKATADMKSAAAMSATATPASNGALPGSGAGVGPKLAVVLALAALALTGCSSLPPLPQGSYAYADTGYSKDSGFSGSAGVHIPLDQGYRLPSKKGLTK